jgi:uncharacterized protein YutE (UPF0331/DUF86 family)
MSRRGDRVIEIEKYLVELKTILPCDLKEYLEGIEKRAACERYFEKIIEGVVDLAFLIIKERGFKSPESSREAFEILSKADIISKELALRLGDAKSMRNWLAHRYGEVDDERVFDAVRNKLIFDVKNFLEAIK